MHIETLYRKIAKASQLAAVAWLLWGGLGTIQAQAASQPETYRLAETTLEREPGWAPDGTPGREDVIIKQREGLITHKTEIDADGHVDSNDNDFAGLSLTTWILLSLILLAIVAMIVAHPRSRRQEF